MDNNRIAPRVPFETSVYLEFERFSGFISEYSVNISETGMFIKSNSPMPVGSVVSFEFRLKDHFSLIQGMGEVVWSREDSLAPERPAGMGIKFREISAQTKELIRTMSSNFLQQGGKLFELDEPLKQAEATTQNISGLFESTPSEAVPTLAGAIKDDLASLFDEDNSVPKTIQEPEFVGRIEDSQAEVKIPIGSNSSMVEIETPFDVSPKTSKTHFNTQAVSEKNSSKSKKKVFASVASMIAILSGGLAYWYFNSTSAPVAVTETPPKTQAVVPVEKSPVVTLATPIAEVPVVAAVSSALPTLPAEVPSVAPTVIPDVKVAEVADPSTVKKLDEAVAPLLASTEVKKITWEAKDSKWILKVEGNGSWTQESFNLQSIREGKPREVIKLFNIAKKYAQLTIPVNSSELAKIRTGHHSETTPKQLHLVLDLKDASLKYINTSSIGNNLEFYFEKAQ